MKKTRIISALMALAIVATPAIGNASKSVSKSSKYQLTTYAKAEVKNGLKKEGGKYYYYVNGKKVKNQWKLVGNKWYYFDANGVGCIGWKQIGGKWYYFNSDASMRTGWLTYNNKKYYLFPKSGTMVTGCCYVGNNWYNFDLSGALIEYETKGTPYTTYYDVTIFTDTNAYTATQMSVKGGDVVFVNKIYNDPSLNMTWGQINYEGDKRGWIIIKDNAQNWYATDNVNTCRDTIDKKFK